MAKNKIKNNIKLPDGSLLALDIDTKLEVTFYKNKRDVVLQKGKVLFSVAKDKNRPFIIKTENSQIEVLGTVFEVDSTEKNNTSVSVKEGRVKVSSFLQNDKTKVLSILEKGQSLSFNNFAKVKELKKVNPNHVASWEEGYLYFEKTSIKEAFEKFSRYIDIEVTFDRYENSIHKIDGQFTIQEFDKFLYILPKIYPIKIKKEKNRIFIQSKS